MKYVTETVVHLLCKREMLNSRLCHKEHMDRYTWDGNEACEVNMTASTQKIIIFINNVRARVKSACNSSTVTDLSTGFVGPAKVRDWWRLRLRGSFSVITATQWDGKNPTRNPLFPLHHALSSGGGMSITEIMSPI